VSELFLFVRPPRRIWPFNGPTTSFWPPLAFASLAAALRASLKDLKVRILDCPALKMGWKSLTREIANLSPDYVGIGEEAVSAAEGLRLAEIAHELGAKVIAGGCTFGNLARQTVSTGLVDVVVRGEGETTIVAVVRALREKNPAEALARVHGIAFTRDGSVAVTPPRPLIDDLDTLPMPAYDLLPLDRYGSGSRNHPDLVTIEHGRGCTGTCGYCVLWRQMGRRDESGPHACYRTKSPERIAEEIDVVTGRYGRRYLCWVDPCFNADARFLEGYVRTMEIRNTVVGQSAWVRADYIARDEKTGLFGRLLACGLNEIFVGIERLDPEGLRRLGCDGKSSSLDAVGRVSCKYPALYVVGSFIYGLPGDSWRTINAMRRAAMDLNIDMAFYIPLTGLPGTDFWDGSHEDYPVGVLGQMDFLTAAGRDSRRLRALTWLLAAGFIFDWRPKRISYSMRTLLAPDPRRRRMNRRLFARGAAFAARQLLAPLTPGNTAMTLPRWYDE
jgi:anaerobic magnesium-protoporphyrin IX monomethyl ester cyclase